MNQAEYRHLQVDHNTENIYQNEGRNYVSRGVQVGQL